MTQMGGLYKQTPVLASFFLAGTLASLGLPMFANFWGELTILTSLWDFSPTICALGATGLIISAIYGLRAFANIFMGSPSEKLSLKIRSIEDLNWKEKLPAVVLLSALLFVGFCPSSITESLNANLSQLLTTTIQSK
jgi:NADH-quinone oxidoreductase subunit M